MRSCITALAFLALVACSIAAPQTLRTMRDIVKPTRHFLMAGTAPSSIVELSEILWAMHALHAVLPDPSDTLLFDSERTKNFCDLAETEVHSDDILKVAAAFRIAVVNKCEGVKADEKVARLAMGVVDDPDSTLAQLCAAVRVIEHLVVTEKHKPDPIKLGQIVTKIMDFTSSDGSFLPSLKASEGTLSSTGEALMALADLHNLGADAVWAVDVVEPLVDVISKALGQLQKSGPTAYWSDSMGNDIQVTASMLSGLSVCNIELTAVDLSADQISQISRFLLRAQPKTPSDAYWLVYGFRFLTKNSFNIPVALIPWEATIFGNAKGDKALLKVAVVDMMGAPVQEPFEVKVVSGKLSALLPATLTEANTGLFTLPVLEANPEPGLYELLMSAKPLASSKHIPIETTKISFSIMGEVEVTTAEIETGGLMTQVSYPDVLTKEIIVAPSQKVSFSFNVRNKFTDKPMAVQQAVALFSSGSILVYVTATLSPAGFYTFDLVPNKLASQFSWVDGTYGIEIIVGDLYSEKAVSWKIGSILLQFSTPTGKQAIVGDRGKQREELLSPKKEIEHTFSKPPRHPPAYVWIAFTALTALPLAVLIIHLLWSGINLAPSGNAFFTLMFWGCICAAAAVLVAYWLWLNMLQTLSLLALLAIPTMFVGQRALLSREIKKD